MKKILITGANSYIGTSFKKWMTQFQDEYQIDTLSVRGDAWREYDFSEYDTMIHLAAIVHKKNVSPKIYYHINRDLTIELAEKAKQEQVKQFIFFSTMAVYGLEEGIISSKTFPRPLTDYGKSKLEAEKSIIRLNTPKFKVLVIRPPMIYGPNAKGNYSKLSKLAQSISFFPKVDNKRSMLYIDNLNAFIKLVIDSNLAGTFHPQNGELVNTSEMVAEIGRVHKRRIYLVSGFNSMLTTLGKNIGILRKIFGNLSYDETVVGYPGSIYDTIRLEYQEKDFVRSIEESEK
ncbi:NAD-dependent epimerase/dehydratase family protein [Enterococcus faecium]|uniref:NAD-dependent epimerase/dehydratase family protein n=1 Tax=Enterococcus faecium TaxID=1352 RepID=UPI0021E9141C|nr:NAD-dependent epimerase/dehydratase family protein [Enterococcus faecium]MCV3202907.1 NAD-dependent epimerase/dehydratase family protein [Enterococcus faecium]MCV6663204.1 NAD-dependent epimerase/dehydratase family protein [Enterococcus faecium]